MHATPRSPLNGHALPRSGRTHTQLLFLLILRLTLGETRVAMQVAILDGAAVLEADRAWMSADASGDLALGAAAGVGRGGCEVGDVLGDWVAGADVGDAYVGGFAGFAEGVVAGIEVLALLGDCEMGEGGGGVVCGALP